MRDTFIVLHFLPTGTNAHAVHDHGVAERLAQGLAAQGGQSVVMAVIGKVYGTPIATAPAAAPAVKGPEIGLKEIVAEGGEDLTLPE